MTKYALLLMLNFGAIHLNAQSNKTTPKNCRECNEKLQKAYDERISGILDAKRRAEIEAQEYASGRKKPSGYSPPPSPPSNNGDADYWKGRYNRKKREAEDERRRRQDAEGRVNILVSDKYRTDTFYQKMILNDQSAIRALRDTISVRNDTVKKRDVTIFKQKKVIDLKNDTIAELRKNKYDISRCFGDYTLKVFALKKGTDNAVPLGNRTLFDGEYTETIKAKSIEKIIVMISVLSDESSEILPATVKLERTDDNKTSDLIPSKEILLRKEKKVGGYYLYTGFYDNEELIWDKKNNRKKSKKRIPKLSSNAKYKISVTYNKADYSTDFELD